MILQRKDADVMAELRELRSTDPAVELQKAMGRKDLRFLGIAGMGLEVPGVTSGGMTNPVVKIRGVGRILGTGDVIESEKHLILNPVARKYAEWYNRLLFAHLLRINDGSVREARRLIDRELLRLEKRDPVKDAKGGCRKRPFCSSTCRAIPAEDLPCPVLIPER